ncbi:STAS/SEC14 domain-containing protein [Psychromarinibacter sp. C21-152]|uniref:STAS/SEC14 domain-containing protein n=1 Tax=Psychromarinibacter sediminicola TaxID=3033385 RepID=A0AAE3NSD0_9RHOB|nr:STAS/SEC14 domain-containing protein [Psychromarinibacter sediminicola]MDF0600749.1 STAS/SEC14 domain-containing protein [Psychromarinibacter sediminicola]
MIELRPTGRDDTISLRIAPPVTEADYRDVLMPAIDAAVETGDGVKLLATIEAGPSEFTLGALWDDARMGLKHWRGFDRIAVVTGSTGMGYAVRALSVVMPCPVKLFDAGEEDAAARWLSESLGAIHQTKLADGVLQVQLLGRLDSAAYAAEIADLNAFIRESDRFRLLLDIRDFDGWQGLGGLAEHFRLVRDHAPALERAAIVGDAGWQKMAAAVGRRILGREARYFAAEDYAAAKDWILEG